MNITADHSEVLGQVLTFLNVKQFLDERVMYYRSLGYHQIKSTNFGKTRFTDKEIYDLLFNTAMEDSFFHDYAGLIIFKKYCDYKDRLKPVYVIFFKARSKRNKKVESFSVWGSLMNEESKTYRDWMKNN